MWIFRPQYVPAYTQQVPFVPQPAAPTTFVYFADSATGSESYLGSPFGSDVPGGSDSALEFPYGSDRPLLTESYLAAGSDTDSGTALGPHLNLNTGGDGPSGSESASWTASVIFADAASGLDGSLEWPYEEDFALDPGSKSGGGGDGGDPTSFLWSKLTDFLILYIPTGDTAAGSDAGLESASDGDQTIEIDQGGLLTVTNAAVASADSGSGEENELVTVTNDAAYSADSGSGVDGSLTAWLDSEIPSTIDAAFGFTGAGDSGTADGPHLGTDLGGDSSIGIDDAGLISVSNASVVSSDSGSGIDLAMRLSISGDSGIGLDPGGGGFSAVFSTTTMLLADSASVGSAAFAELLGSDNGIVGFDLGVPGLLSTIGYYVYANSGTGDPIDYDTPIATMPGFNVTTWTSTVLAFPGTWSFGVRAFDACGIEQNVDCAVTFILDSNGIDITNRPLAPVGLRGFPIAGGAVKLEWVEPPSIAAKVPTGFHVYQGLLSVDYSVPVATVSFSSGIAGSFVAIISGLVNGQQYRFGVRAFNATAEETNTAIAIVTADSMGPLAVASLTATAV